MDYIHDMRQKIGHDPLILAGAAVLILNEQGELLMLLRTDNGCWGVPGGSMEPGERLEETAARETLEECGLHVRGLALLGVFSGPEIAYRYPNGDMTYNVTAAYVAHEASGEIALNLAEHTRWEYFPLERLPEAISPPIKVILEKFKASRREAGASLQG